MDTIEGNIERITYYSSESGYCVLKLSLNQPELTRRVQSVTVVGVMPELQSGENVRFTGQWTNHPTHGQQFKAETVIQLRPATIEGMKRYLGSGLIKGIGRVTAKRIVDFFGQETMDVLDRTPELIREVPGVGNHRAGLIAKAWREQQAVKEVMLFLQSYGINTGVAVKIYKTYGDDSLTQVQSDPYKLVDDIHGIGFKTADRIARQLGLPEFSPPRLRAGLLHALREATSNGHVYLPTENLLDKAVELLEVERPLIEKVLLETANTDSIIVEDVHDSETDTVFQAAYLPPMYHSERGIARRIQAMLEEDKSRLSRLRAFRNDEWDTLIRNITATDSIQLSAQQERAVHAALTSKVSILTGGPGTGKTTTLRTIIAVLETTRHKFHLASPTGRAAKRLNEATGHPAQTIHRLLGYSPQEGFHYSDDNPLDADIVVVDEASMIDLVLFYQLLKAIKTDTHLLLVGDVDQLPSVGAGDILRDLIKSHICPVMRLDTIFRQAETSMIIQNAHRINKGFAPNTENKSQDFFFFGEEQPEAAANLVVDIVQNRIPSRFGFHAIHDIQVLAPMYNGKIGINALNIELQKTLNPKDNKAEKLLHGTLFRVGDKVMQTRNDYTKEVYNGDIGFVYGFDFEEQLMQVMVEGRLVTYDWSDTDQLTLAYAVSVHKSQGAEYPVVVLPIMTQHYMMLQRNLIYTAITRAKKMVVLVGTRKAINIAVQNDAVANRYSALAWRLLL